MDNQVQYTLTLKDLLTGKLKEADNAAKGLEGTINGVQSVLGALGIGVGIAGVVAFTKQMVEAGTKVEDAQTGLTTLLKDSVEAGRVIENTMQDATKTPFAFEGLLSANKALISAGENADGARATVLDLANAIAATGGSDVELQRMVSNLQQIRNTGRATAMDIRQFGNAGINIYQLLADATGKPISAVQDMEVSYELLTYALKKAHDEGGMYANGLENMAGNTSVKISNLGDSIFQLSVKIYKNLKPAIVGVLDAMSSFMGFISEHGTEMKALAVGVTTAAAAWGVYTIATNAAAVATGILNAVMAVSPWAWAAVAIGAVAAALYYAYQKIEVFRQGVYAVGYMIKEYVRLWIDLFYGLKDVIVGAFNLEPDKIESGLRRITDVYKNQFQRIGAAAKEGWQAGATPAAITTDDKKKAKPTLGGKLTPLAAGADIAPKNASAPKAVTINISINKMIETFKISTTNLTESTSKVHEAVSNVLLQAINDSQIVGNI